MSMQPGPMGKPTQANFTWTRPLFDSVVASLSK